MKNTKIILICVVILITIVGFQDSIRAGVILSNGHVDYIHNADIVDHTPFEGGFWSNLPHADIERLRDNTSSEISLSYNFWSNRWWVDPFGDGDDPSDGSGFPLWGGASWDNITVQAPDWGGAIAWEWEPNSEVSLDEIRFYHIYDASHTATAVSAWIRDASTGDWVNVNSDFDLSNKGEFEQFTDDPARDYARTVLQLDDRIEADRVVTIFGTRSGGRGRLSQMEFVLIPEPSTLALLGLGGLLLMKRRRL